MTYTIELPEADAKTYQKVDAAKAFADKTSKAQGVELKVVDQETGSVVHVATPVEGRNFHPYERVLRRIRIQGPDFPGFTPAYDRVRIATLVYRGEDGSWLVWDGRTGNSEIVNNTTEARVLCTEMRHGKTL